MATSKLIQWLPEILQATDEDIARFGPQAAQVRSLAQVLKTLSNEEKDFALRVYNTIPAGKSNEWRRSLAESIPEDRLPYLSEAENELASIFADQYGRGFEVGAFAGTAESAGDIINKELYDRWVGPITAAQQYGVSASLVSPAAKGKFIELISRLNPMTGQDVRAIEGLASSSWSPQREVLENLLSKTDEFSANVPLSRRIELLRNNPAYGQQYVDTQNSMRALEEMADIELRGLQTEIEYLKSVATPDALRAGKIMEGFFTTTNPNPASAYRNILNWYKENKDLLGRYEL